MRQLQTCILKDMPYDGTQLRSQYAYFEHRILGDSLVAWRGACNVDFNSMLDGEDLLDQSQICGSDMVHFIFEVFERNLFAGVCLQRLFASQVQVVAEKLSSLKLVRQGDDLFLGEGKLSISIATLGPFSTLIHFAVNVSNDGTPVKTACLQDLKIEPRLFMDEVLQFVRDEYANIWDATYKVKPAHLT